MKKRLKLLFVVTEDWYFVSHRLALAVAAQQAGFEVAVATRVGECHETIRVAGIRLIPFRLSRRIGNPVCEVAALVRLYLQERPDIVHHVALKPIMYGAISAWIARVPAQVHAVTGLGWLFTSRIRVLRLIRPVVPWLLARLLNAQGSLTIVQNQDDRTVLIRSYLPESRLRLIRGAGVDTDVFQPSVKLPGPIYIALASRMLWGKGVGDFVEAAYRLRQDGVQARFVLVGAGDSQTVDSIPTAQLEEWHKSGIIEWWGYRNNMAAVFSLIHIFCLPTGYGEGVPKVLLEAAASGLPTVASDTPGCREIVRAGDNGFLVPPRDGPACVRALRILIDDGDLRAKMGARAREIALAEFCQKRVIKETLAVYQELAQRNLSVANTSGHT